MAHLDYLAARLWEAHPATTLLQMVMGLLVSLMSSGTVVLLLRRARGARGTRRRNWCALAGLALGFGVWATQLISLMGHHFLDATGYSIPLLALSLGLGSAAAAASILAASFPRVLKGRMLASFLLGGSLAAMNYGAMAAFRIPARLEWDPLLIAGSFLTPAFALYPALQLALTGRRKASALTATLAFAVATGWLHTATAGGATTTPTGLALSGIAVSPGTLAAGVGAVSLAIFSLGLGVQLVHNYVQFALARQERQLSRLVRAVSDYAIAVIDNQGRFIQWNVGAEKLTGYTAEEARGMPFAQIFTDRDRADHYPERSLAKAQESGMTTGHARCLRSDGSVFWAHGTVQKMTDAKGCQLGYTLIMRDVSDFMDARKQIFETTRRLDTALSNMHEGLALFDAKECLVLCNRRFRELWKLSEADTRPGTPLGRLVVAGFMNPPREGNTDSDSSARALWAFRRLLEESTEAPDAPPAIAELGDMAVSIANRTLDDGGWVTTCEDITLQRRSEAQIQHMALHDALTGLPNRIRFNQRLDLKLQRAARSGWKVGVIAIDLDRFKEINDTHGHAVGDHVLQEIGRRILAESREGEIVARFGGDEFAAAKIFDNPEAFDGFIARIRAAISHEVADADHAFDIGASLGIAIYPDDGNDRETLLNNADLAMYRAKAMLGERVSFYEPSMDETVRTERQLASDLKHAVAGGELYLLYQPQRSLRTHELCGYEALVRWQHPRRGEITPDRFIPIAEKTGSIFAIGEWVLREACREARLWPDRTKVAVNISPIQFLQPTLVETVRAILVETGLSPGRLELEITETAIIADKARALHCLRQIKAMGVSVAIDDFGTGYSSLDTLHSFPFDKIKIDKSFLLKSESSAQAREIIRAVLALGRSLNIPVLAEGVETSGHLAVLETEGCDEAQGYYFGRPNAAPSLQNRRQA